MFQPKYLWNCWQKILSDGETWKQDLCCAWPKTICKSECIVADSTDSKLVLWVSNIDKVNARDSYKFQNVTVKCYTHLKTLLYCWIMSSCFYNVIILLTLIIISLYCWHWWNVQFHVLWQWNWNLGFHRFYYNCYNCFKTLLCCWK